MRQLNPLKMLCSKHLTPLVLMLCLLMGSKGFSASDFTEVEEYELKASFLYNFSKFTTWPNQDIDEQAIENICVLGENPFGDLLDQIASALPTERSFSVKYTDELENLSDCHVVFIAKSAQSQLPSILSAIQSLPILTVSDIDGFAVEGGIIGLEIKDSRIQLVINISASNLANLSISSKLLELATIINPTAAEPSP